MLHRILLQYCPCHTATLHHIENIRAVPKCKGRREGRQTKTIRGKDGGEKQAERQEGKHSACHTKQPRVRSRKGRACHQKGCNWRPMCQKVGTASNSKAKKGEKTGANERQAGREAAPRSQAVWRGATASKKQSNKGRPDDSVAWKKRGGEKIIHEKIWRWMMMTMMVMVMVMIMMINQ